MEELERAGFSVDVCPNFHDLEVEKGVSPMNMVYMMDHGSRRDFKATHDVRKALARTMSPSPGPFGVQGTSRSILSVCKSEKMALSRKD